MKRLLLLFLLVSPAVAAYAQPAAEPDTLHLGMLRAAAVQQDPRFVQPELLVRASELRRTALRSQRRPQLTITGQATMQNEVTEIPLDVPGQDAPSPPHEQFRTQLETEWMLYDGGRIQRQAAAERAQLAENVAGVAVTLYALREATTEAFFGALLSAARAETLTLTAEDLEAQLRLIQRQADDGAALAAEAAALEAELIRVRQQAEEAKAARRAALDILADLTGTSITPADTLVLPDLDAETSQVLSQLEAGASESDETAVRALLDRPELERSARMAERAEAEARARAAQTRPSLSLFGQAGIGRPGPFNFLSDDVSEYGLAGVRVRWPVFDGGRARREAEAIRVQTRIAETEAEAFVRQVARDIEDKRADLARLDTAIAADERAVSLREEVLRVARRQLEEGVLLPDIYMDRLTDLFEARLTLERHRIERAQAQALLLSALGRYPEPRLLPAGAVEDLPNFE